MKQKLQNLRALALSQKNKAAAAVVASAAAVAAPAHAAVDVTAVVAEITGAVNTVTTLGIAVLSLVVTVKLFTWVRGALK